MKNRNLSPYLPISKPNKNLIKKSFSNLEFETPSIYPKINSIN